MTGKPVTTVPFEDDFGRWSGRLSRQERDQVERALDAKINGNEIHTAGWLPGSDWGGTPFQSIYEKAALRDVTLAAKCFGIFVWKAFQRHPKTWTSGRFEKDGLPIGSRTYFRVPSV